MKYTVLGSYFSTGSAILVVTAHEEVFEVYGIKSTGIDYIAHNLSCPSGKDVYVTYSDAYQALKQRGSSRRANKKIYKCEICGHYHLTTIDSAYRHPKPYNRSKSERDLYRMYSSISRADLDELIQKKSRPINIKAFRNRMAGLPIAPVHNF